MVSLFAALVPVAALGACADGGEPDGRGPIYFADGHDTSLGRQIGELVNAWNKEHPEQQVEFVELAESSDDHRAQLVAHAQDSAAVRGTDRGRNSASGPACYDVMALDIIWTAEFAHWNYIVPLNEKDVAVKAFMDEAIDGVRYKGKLWAVPLRTDVGLLYYRKDILDDEHAKVPTTWEDLQRLAKTIAPKYHLDGYITQLDRYEGFTVNLQEGVFAEKGTVLGDDGEVGPGSDIKKGFDRLLNGVRDGWISRASLTFNEEGTRRAFQDGRALFMRNWTYAYQLLNAPDSPVAGKVGVARLPTPSALGGWNLAISRCSKRRATALDFVHFLTRQASEEQLFTNAGFAPARKTVYQTFRTSHPHLKIIHDSVKAARHRGTSPYYEQISGLIQTRLRNGLLDPSGNVSINWDTLIADLHRAADGS